MDAEIPRTGWHVLRHTFATDLYARGAYPKSVQDLIGHSTINMTLRYTHVVPEVLRATVRLLERPSGVIKAPCGQPDSSGGADAARLAPSGSPILR